VNQWGLERPSDECWQIDGWIVRREVYSFGWGEWLFWIEIWFCMKWDPPSRQISWPPPSTWRLVGREDRGILERWETSQTQLKWDLLHAYPIERASNRRLGGSWSKFLFLPISYLTQARGSWSCPRSHRNGFSKRLEYSKDSLCIQNLILVGSLCIGTQVQTASRKICQFDRKKDRWKQIKTEFTA
jgi:hypothetical protein